MEVSGVVFSRQVPSFFFIAGLDTHLSSSSKMTSLNGMSGSGSVGEIRLVGGPDCGVRFGHKRVRSAKSNFFYDKGNLEYYYVNPRCGGKKTKKDKIKNKVFSGDLTTEKQLKLIKGLMENSSAFSDMGLQLESPGDLGSQVEEASELLMKQFQQLKAEKKELKRMKKQEKAKLKAIKRSANMHNSSSLSSSSSSESSDSECEEDMYMNSLRNSLATIQPKLKEGSLSFPQEIATLSLPSLMTPCQDVPTKNHGIEEGRLKNQQQEEEFLNRSGSHSYCSTNGIDRVNHSITRSSSIRIEVCMGNKCKKAGAVALLEEFERVMGVEGSVVGCKCMGKCKKGPNVRVSNFVDETQAEATIDGSLKRVDTSPLCIGVGLEDVGAIVSNLCGGDKKDLGPDYFFLDGSIF